MTMGHKKFRKLADIINKLLCVYSDVDAESAEALLQQIVLLFWELSFFALVASVAEALQLRDCKL